MLGETLSSLRSLLKSSHKDLLLELPQVQYGRFNFLRVKFFPNKYKWQIVLAETEIGSQINSGGKKDHRISIVI